jgi:hypothetical protein
MASFLCFIGRYNTVAKRIRTALPLNILAVLREWSVVGHFVIRQQLSLLDGTGIRAVDQ